ncbi:MAG: pyridoxal 5'-phosphate synthase glutaminase subunit PdxT [Acidobacteria bacterium]|nr:pyridoxal 5'-phosphate synthase glutaminase subunit PdxT [Acidobacteriota bacterium]
MPVRHIPQPVVGVLALQGDFEAHRHRLAALGAVVRLVKMPDQFREIDGLVIPGGESTNFLRLLGGQGMAALRACVRARPVFGTCAGAILLAAEVENPAQPALGAIDIRIRRNAYGRQIDSFIGQGRIDDQACEMVFIRAPRIVRVGPRVEIVAALDAQPVAVRQGTAMAATFHPELSDDPRLHEMFLGIVARNFAAARDLSAIDRGAQHPRTA